MSASVQAMFDQVDANHDGVITAAEFSAGVAPVAPVVYSAGTIPAAAPVYYSTGNSASVPVQYVSAAPPVYVTGSGYSASVPVTYSSSPMTYSGAPMMYTAPPTDTYPPGARITYQSITTGQTFPGSIVDMYTDGGCQVMLDIDGGVKDVLFEDMWRVKPEGGATVTAATTETTTTTTKAKKKKSTKKKAKGCC